MASTRKRMSVVRPETAAAPSRAVKARSFHVSPMGVGLAPVGLAAVSTQTLLPAESPSVLPGAQTAHPGWVDGQDHAGELGYAWCHSVTGAGRGRAPGRPVWRQARLEHTAMRRSWRPPF